jgi:hypothetical protein
MPEDILLLLRRTASLRACPCWRTSYSILWDIGHKCALEMRVWGLDPLRCYVLRSNLV